MIKRSPVQFKVPRPATKHVYKIATYAQVQSSAEAEAKLRSKIESNINASTGLPGETADAEVDTPNMSDASLAANAATAPTTAESASAKRTISALVKNDATPNTTAIEESASSPANTLNIQRSASPDAAPPTPRIQPFKYWRTPSQPCPPMPG